LISDSNLEERERDDSVIRPSGYEYNVVTVKPGTYFIKSIWSKRRYSRGRGFSFIVSGILYTEIVDKLTL